MNSYYAAQQLVAERKAAAFAELDRPAALAQTLRTAACKDLRCRRPRRPAAGASPTLAHSKPSSFFFTVSRETVRAANPRRALAAQCAVQAGMLVQAQATVGRIVTARQVRVEGQGPRAKGGAPASAVILID